MKRRTDSFERGETRGVHVLDADSPVEAWRAALGQYYRDTEFAPYQIQSEIKLYPAIQAYRDLLYKLAAAEDEVAAIFRTGYYFIEASDEPRNIEDVTYFLIDNPRLEVAVLEDPVAPAYRSPLPNREGITLIQPVLGYAQRSKRHSSWAEYVEYPVDEHDPTFSRTHALVPTDGRIVLSYIDGYTWPNRVRPSHRGLDYAAHDKKFGSISVTPTHFNEHMGVAVGNHEVWRVVQGIDMRPMSATWFDKARLKAINERARAEHIIGVSSLELTLGR